MLPSLGEIFGISLYTYPILMGLAWGLAYQWGRDVYENKLTTQTWNILFFGIFFFAWVGAKLLFFITAPVKGLLYSSSFWLGGGFVFYGGLLGAFIFIILFYFAYKKFYWKNFAYLVPILLIGHAIGRLGCFLAGCCYGKEMAHFHFRHPVQLYEAFFLFCSGIYLNRQLKKEKNEVFAFAFYLGSYAAFRFVIEFLRDDDVRGSYGIFSTSQWISIIFLIISSILYLQAKRSDKSGI